MKSIAHTDYLRLLEPWVKPSKQYLYIPSGRPDLVCYGTGYNGWGMQTHQKAFAAYAVMAVDPELDEERTGATRQELLELALRMLRFTLESHKEGGYQCEDGTSWGHTWISALGTERMMHGAEAIEEHLTREDRELLRKVLVSESDWLLDHYEIVGHLLNETGRNRPESNLWNGCMLHRTAAMYPDAPRAAEYKEKGSRFLVNSISLASDKTSASVVDGKPVSEWFVGENFFESYALNHHGYLNVGYMVICLSNAAMLHFMYKRRGQTPPQSLYHHLEDLWKVVKPLIFPDGRMIRVGGDTRVRYCYCQDYLIPSWILLADLIQDEDCPAFEAGWLAQVGKEMEFNGDGTYLSSRCKDLQETSPIYYTRLESDRAVTLSYGAYWRRLYKSLPAFAKKEKADTQAASYAWQDEYHGASVVKGERRLASWTWRAAEGPEGLCLPADGSDLAEWRYNLAGRIKGTGAGNYNQHVDHNSSSFEGGFLTFGQVLACSEELLAEQQAKDVLAKQLVVAAALPDDCTMVVMQYAKTVTRSYVTSVQGLLLHVPNDLFNGNRRTYYYGTSEKTLEGVGSKEQLLDTESIWLNVDNRLGVVQAYGASSLTLCRPGKRQIGIKHKHQSDRMGMLYADEICSPVRKGLQDVAPDTVLLDTGFVVQAGADHGQTFQYAAGGHCAALPVETDADAVRAMLVRGTDGQSYLLIANFGGQSISAGLTLPAATVLRDLAGQQEAITPAEGHLSLELEPETAHLYAVIS